MHNHYVADSAEFEILREYDGKIGFFIKVFFINARPNGNKWAVTWQSVLRNMPQTVGIPIVLVPDLTHPDFHTQNFYAKGYVVDYQTNSKKQTAHVIARIMDAFTIQAIKDGKLKFSSPAVEIRGSDFGRMEQGVEWLEDWTPIHLALVRTPAYGKVSGKIKGVCEGDGNECKKKLYNAADFKESEHPRDENNQKFVSKDGGEGGKYENLKNPPILKKTNKSIDKLEAITSKPMPSDVEPSPENLNPADIAKVKIDSKHVLEIQTKDGGILEIDPRKHIDDDSFQKVESGEWMEYLQNITGDVPDAKSKTIYDPYDKRTHKEITLKQKTIKLDKAGKAELVTTLKRKQDELETSGRSGGDIARDEVGKNLNMAFVMLKKEAPDPTQNYNDEYARKTKEVKETADAEFPTYLDTAERLVDVMPALDRRSRDYENSIDWMARKVGQYSEVYDDNRYKEQANRILDKFNKKMPDVSIDRIASKATLVASIQRLASMTQALARGTPFHEHGGKPGYWINARGKDVFVADGQNPDEAILQQCRCAAFDESRVNNGRQ